ncbi:MAG: hypothetical protein DMG44_00160 [Acidobacteria bacterium]|jgi:hypothetical protein|nr:MAG: hypothetical protein DMG44_00160 [Acidobacteriota bacterium]
MTSPPSSFELGINMKRLVKFFIMIFLLGAGAVCAGDARVKLIPDLHAGQTITYLIRYRSDKNVKTESNVVAPMAPNAAQMDAHGLLQVDVLDVQHVGGKTAIHARSRFRTLDSGVWVKKPGDKEPHWQVQKVDPEGKQIEFTILPDGSVEKITGLDALFPEQQQAWQQWVARFATAWTLPQNGVKLGEKWKSEQPENGGAPIAGLYWARESAYVRNENCHAQQVSITGELSPSSGPPETCAVLLTTAALKQNSSPKDTTPEAFKLHELKTRGTAKGANEIITYISLKTRLVVRATEEAHQSMDVTVAKADESNRVHYNVDAKSHSEVLLVTETPLSHP